VKVDKTMHIDPEDKKHPEPKDQAVKTDHGPEHVAPTNPQYSGSFDESAGDADTTAHHEREDVRKG